MTVDALATWQSTFAALPKVADNSWAAPFAQWANDRVTSKMSLPGITGAGLTFTFNKATFESELITLTETADKEAGITAFADAWKTAILVSVAAVAAGSSIGSPSPATTWSSVSSTVITPASITAGRAKIIELKDAPLVGDALESEFPIKFREAFLLLRITTTGLNSVSPTPGPLVDTARAPA